HDLALVRSLRRLGSGLDDTSLLRPLTDDGGVRRAARDVAVEVGEAPGQFDQERLSAHLVQPPNRHQFTPDGRDGRRQATLREVLDRLPDHAEHHVTEVPWRDIDLQYL